MSTYRVKWEIDVDADSHEEAARKAQASQIRPGTTATYFEVAEWNQRTAKLDSWRKLELGPVAPLSPELQALIEAAREATRATDLQTDSALSRLATALAPFSESSPQTLTEEEKRVKEYVERQGVKCPCCSSSSVEGGDTEINRGIFYQNCYCTECESEWTDRYLLVGFGELIDNCNKNANQVPYDPFKISSTSEG